MASHQKIYERWLIMAPTKLNQSRAAELIIRISETGVSRNLAKPNSLTSLGTQRDYKVCVKSYLDWRDDNGLSKGSQDKKADLIHYLKEQSENYQQKTLCQHRMALNAAFFKKLPPVKSLLDTVQSSRDYRLSEVLLLTQNIEPKNAIAILLCFYSGLRAHELATLQRTNEGERNNTRSWSKELFANFCQHVTYVVIGKGGLRRHVAIPTELSKIIEARRLPEPRKVRDREIYYQMNYDLGFGKALSQSFSRASIKHLGWSTGLHGLRHSYTKNRIRHLIKMDFSLDAAKLIVSQELGHFRPSIVNCYMR